MVLYMCAMGRTGGSVPKPFAHPCARAAKALDDVGHSYEVEQVRGGTMKLWTWPARARDRAEVERLSGQRGVPILVLDDGEVIVGSAEIVSWAQSHSPASTSA